MKPEYRLYETELETRADEEKKPVIEGHAAVFNKWAKIGDMFMERIKPGAFVESIKNDDIRALINHDPNYVLGRNKSGTLRLKEDKRGLHMEVDPPTTDYAANLMELIDRGDISDQSFGFRTLEDKWETKEIDGTPMEHRTITKAQLFDVSPVAFAAYPMTDVSVRSAQDVWEAHLEECPCCEDREDETPPETGVSGEGEEGDAQEHDVPARMTSRRNKALLLKRNKDGELFDS